MMAQAAAPRLLYVEDDDDLRTLVTSSFVRWGFETVSFGSAEEALDELRRKTYDVVVTDYNLVGETAAWLLRMASAEGLLAHTAALVLTSEERPAGVDGFDVLRKPWDAALLLATIRTATRRATRRSRDPRERARSVPVR